ncbi:hypothetical protein Lal_00027822 [Lupinus albus]|nr:hypothetical protein Lal_00027822 [Lupinus albus]
MVLRFFFDFDDIGGVIDGDLGKHFDVELTREGSRPKGLPLENVGEIRHEEFYTEETGTLNYEFGNLIRWRKTFGNVVLIMYCSGLEWRLLYGRRTIWTLLYKKEIWIKHTSTCRKYSINLAVQKDFCSYRIIPFLITGT